MNAELLRVEVGAHRHRAHARRRSRGGRRRRGRTRSRRGTGRSSSRRRARAPARPRSPSGAGIRSTIASSTCSTLTPVLAGDADDLLGATPPSSSDTSAAAPSGSADGRSILLTTGTISRSFSIARYALARVCASIPCAASTTSTAPSHACSERETSYVKSTWPGVSIRLSSWPFHCDAHGLRLDRDPALALELHRVEELVPHLALGDGLRELQNPVGEGRLAMVDVRDDREVADAALVHG